MEPEIDIGAVFAELTVLLEDAAAFAEEGQGAGVTPERAVDSAAELDGTCTPLRPSWRPWGCSPVGRA